MPNKLRAKGKSEKWASKRKEVVDRLRENFVLKESIKVSISSKKKKKEKRVLDHSYKNLKEIKTRTEGKTYADVYICVCT